MIPAIEIKHLTKKFRSGFLMKEVTVLSDLNLSIPAGTAFGFLGPNGAGKTTTIKLLTGLIHATSGEALIFGSPVSDFSVRSKIGFLPERPYFYDYLSSSEYLHFCGELFGMTRSERNKKISELLELVGLTDKAGEQLRKYSKGMLQRVGLAQALINDPELVILDEPMSGLDPVGRKQVRDIIVHLKDAGKTVFFSTHVLSDAEMICDQVGIIIGGKCQNIGDLNTLLSPKTSLIEVSIKGISEASLSRIESISSSKKIGNEAYVLKIVDESLLPKLLNFLHREKTQIVSIIPHKETLEELFMGEIRERQS